METVSTVKKFTAIWVFWDVMVCWVNLTHTRHPMLLTLSINVSKLDLVADQQTHEVFVLHLYRGKVTMVLGSTQPLVKMSTRNIPGGYRRPVREADDLTTFTCRLS